MMRIETTRLLNTRNTGTISVISKGKSVSEFMAISELKSIILLSHEEDAMS